MSPRPGHLALLAGLTLARLDPGQALGQAAEPGHEAPTFAGAPAGPDPLMQGEISRLLREAAPGATVRVPAGVYREHIRIVQPVTLVADGRVVIDGGGRGDIVEIAAPDVTFMGFTVRNTGDDLDKENAAIRALAPRACIEGNTLDDILFGIDLRESPDSIIRGNRIGGKPLDIARRGDGLRLWRSDRALLENNVVHDGRDSILWYSTGVTVRGNVGRNCRYGLHLMFSDDITIVDNEFSNNSVGIYLMYSAGVRLAGNRLLRNRGPSGYGLGLKETDRFTVRDNLIVGNRAGVYVDGSPFTRAQPGIFEGNTLASNDVGFTFLPSARGNEIVGNNFVDNIDQVIVSGRGNLDANRFWRGDDGNFWSDYTGYDVDGDGIGDFVHESATLFENLMDRQPALRLFLFSPAQQAIEFVGRAVPAVRPEPRFVDEVPLMRPVPVRPQISPDPRARLGMLASGGTLLALSAGLFALAGVLPCARRTPKVTPHGALT